MTTAVRSGVRNDRLLVALVSGCDVREAARESGYSVKTVTRRLRDPAFRRRVEEARRDTFTDAMARLGALSGLAVSRLRSLLDSSSERIVLAASLGLLDAQHRAGTAELRRQLDDLSALLTGLPEQETV